MNEGDLVIRVKAGNTEAFRYLILSYQKMVLHIAGRIITRQEDLEDVCQEVFLKVIRNIGSFRGDSKLSTWIASIAYHTSLSHLKKSRRRLNVYIEDISTAEKRWLAEDYHAGFEKKELKTLLLEMIEKLPVHYRSVLTLYYLEEFSYSEVGKITGMPEGTVKSYLNRARNLLKEKIEMMETIQKQVLLSEYGRE